MRDSLLGVLQFEVLQQVPIAGIEKPGLFCMNAVCKAFQSSSVMSLQETL